MKTRKNQEKILGNQGKIREFHEIKKWEPCLLCVPIDTRFLGFHVFVRLIIIWNGRTENQNPPREGSLSVSFLKNNNEFLTCETFCSIICSATDAGCYLRYERTFAVSLRGKIFEIKIYNFRNLHFKHLTKTNMFLSM